MCLPCARRGRTQCAHQRVPTAAVMTVEVRSTQPAEAAEAAVGTAAAEAEAAVGAVAEAAAAEAVAGSASPEQLLQQLQCRPGWGGKGGTGQ